MAPKKFTKFHEEWLLDPNFKDWVVEDPNCKSNAKCKYCFALIDLSNMGKNALLSHSKSQKHKNLMKDLNSKNPIHSWLKSANSSSSNTVLESLQPIASSSSITAPTADAPLTESSNNNFNKKSSFNEGPMIENYMHKESVLKSEIYWAFNTIAKHYSFNSSSQSSSLFKVMFPDSEIASKFTCSDDKLRYLSVFGLAPYFEEKLFKTLETVPIYSIFYDESFNRTTKNEQMDFIIRYWNDDQSKVVDQYYTSKFIGHATADDLLRNFREATEASEERKILQISMDGPNVNKKFFRDFVHERDSSMPSLIDIGSCGLHVLHGAFRTGFEKTSWKIDRLLKSLWYIFDESPARRENYTLITGSQIFPLQFCGTRWIEDSSVAERAIALWKNISMYVKKTGEGKKSQVPKCSSYITIQNAVNDPLTLAKLHFFVYISKSMKSFLNDFQSSKPLAPLLAEEVGSVLKDLMGKFMVKDIISGSLSDMAQLDVSDSKNLLKIDKIDVGFASKAAMTSEEIGKVKESEFRDQCRQCLQAIVMKLIERSPIKYEVVHHIRSFSPFFIRRHPNSCISVFEELLAYLVKNGYLVLSQCDSLVKQYRQMVEADRRAIIQKIAVFQKTDRLDSLFYDMIGNEDNYKELWDVCKTILCLSHGQSSVERGFSINKDVLQTNMDKHTIIAKRRIYDSLKLQLGPGMEVYNITINKDMLSHCKKARGRYSAYLEEEKENKKKR